MWRGSNTFIFKWKIYRWEILLVFSFCSTEKSSLFSSLSHSFFATFSLICFLLTWLKCVGYAWKIILAATFPSVQSTMLCVKLYAYSPNVISLESALWKKSGEYDWKLSALSATPAFWSLPHGALLNEAKSCIHNITQQTERCPRFLSYTCTAQKGPWIEHQQTRTQNIIKTRTQECRH